MSRWILAIASAIALLAAAAPSQTVGYSGGNGGLINLPGGGGYSSFGLEKYLGEQRIREVGENLDATQLIPLYTVLGEGGRLVILGWYQGSMIQAATNGSTYLVYQGTVVQAINPGSGQQIISRWTCRCHPGVTNEIVTDISALYPEVAEKKHDDALNRQLKRHPPEVPTTH